MANNDDNNIKKDTTQPEAPTTETPIADAPVEQTQQPDYKALFLRTTADLQNFKRRTERERSEWATLIHIDVIEKMIPILDDLERALSNTGQQTTPETIAWLEGFQLIAKNFKKTLTGLGVEEISTAGLFNPELHEALMQVTSPEHRSGEIVQEFRKGYTLKGKVLRHAQVSVAS
ncbi:MAG: nucleotide exchange factor GrpE [Candidatus Babeliales bacterium]|jgi:molecular chaperone GrpE